MRLSFFENFEESVRVFLKGRFLGCYWKDQSVFLKEHFGAAVKVTVRFLKGHFRATV